MKLVFLEDLLLEDIEEVYTKYYAKDYDRETFDKLIAADPTFKATSNKLGTYGKWILTIAKKTSGWTYDEIFDTLKKFNEVKNKLPSDHRDIMRVKSLDELKTLVNTVGAEAASKSDFRRKAEQAVDPETGRKIDGIKYITTIGKWEIFTPETYEASKWLRGQNAEWCTGRHNDDSYYRSYTSNGQLIIFIDNTKPDEPKHTTASTTDEPKYQLAIYSDGKFREFRSAVNSFSWGDTYEKFVEFLSKNNILSQVINDPYLGKIKCIADLKTIEELKNGKPYEYKGGKVDEKLKTLIKRVSFSKDVTTIDERAFAKCTALEVVEIPATITSIGRGCFASCTALKKVKFDDGCTAEISIRCFDGCANLKEVYIPMSVTKINAFAFGAHDGEAETQADCPNVKILIEKKKGADGKIDPDPANHRITVKQNDVLWLRKHIQNVLI